MSNSYPHILKNLKIHLETSILDGKIFDKFMPEPSSFFTKNQSCKNVFWLSAQQIFRASTIQRFQAPTFVVKIIGDKERFGRNREKMKNYREAGVQVVWQIFPKMQEVDVYFGQNLENMTTCSGQKLCSAAPALPDFLMPAEEIFSLK